MPSPAHPIFLLSLTLPGCSIYALNWLHYIQGLIPPVPELIRSTVQFPLNVTIASQTSLILEWVSLQNYHFFSLFSTDVIIPYLNVSFTSVKEELVTFLRPTSNVTVHSATAKFQKPSKSTNSVPTPRLNHHLQPPDFSLFICDELLPIFWNNPFFEICWSTF